MTAPQASSRLEMLQARFQQKQLQEKEQKLLQLYDQQQQRAYQVVQRGSAGSNSSNHGSNTVRTTTTTHTTSTSQGGKVRQMFDERRQTTVKGIDRSYPLEPLENKLRKQTNTNGIAMQRNSNLTVNRQSVSIKRVGRADVNSNVNGGKPIISYHEEVTRESFGPSVRHHDDEDEFGVENRVATFANGHYRHDADNEQEEALDQETIERNRMMAKIHLMGFDDSLKHRVRNDLESEEFPEYLMVDVPDKLPKRNVTKKLSQAEARLERFKNANAKRSNMPKQSTPISTVIKKRSEQMIPARSSTRRSEIAGTSPTSARSGSSQTSERSQRILRNAKNPLPVIKTGAIDGMSKRRRESSDIVTFDLGDSPQSFLRKATKEETTSRISPRSSNHFKSLTSDGKIIIRHSPSPQFFCRESERSGTTMSIDRKSDRKSVSPLFYRKTLTKQSTSPQFFLSESEQSRRTSESKSPLWDGRRISSRLSMSPQYFPHESERSETTMSTDRETSKSSEWNKEILTKQNATPQYFSKKLRTNTSFDRKISPSKSPSYKEQIFKKRKSPQFFCKESKRSGTTMSIDHTVSKSKSPSYDREIIKKRSTSPQFFSKESERFGTTMSESRSPSYDREIIKKQSTSPQFFCKESERSGTTMSIDHTVNKSRSPSYDREIIKKQSTSPQFFCKESERSGTTMSIDHTVNKSRSPSYDREIIKKRSTSPQFFCKESERSGTTMSIDRKISESKSPSYDRKILTKRNTYPQLLSKKTGKLSSKIGTKPSRITRDKRTSPQFYCRESKTSATTMLIEPRSSSTDSTKNILKQHNYALNTSYKQPVKPLSSINKKISSTQDKHTPSPSIVKRDVKEASKENEISSITETRRSSRISETSATSASSIVSLKYGLEFDNIFQSSRLVRKFMKSQDGEQREIRQSPSKRNIKNVKVPAARINQSKNRYKTPPLSQKVRSPSVESKRRTTPESPRKSITPIEVDMEIQEITMTDHRIERENKLQKPVTPLSTKRRIDRTYTRSPNNRTRTSITYPVRKTHKQRTSILESNVFKPKQDFFKKSKESKDHRSDRDSEGSAISLKRLGYSPVSESSQRIITRFEEDENRVNEVKSRTQERTWKQSVKDQTKCMAVQSKQSKDQQRTSSRSPNRIDRIGSFKARSPDFSIEEKYAGDTVPSTLYDSKKRNEGTQIKFDQLQSLRCAQLMRGALKDQNLSTDDEQNQRRSENKEKNAAVDEVDAEIDVKYQMIVEGALNEKNRDPRKIIRPNSVYQTKNKDISSRKTNKLNVSKKTIPPTRGCSRQHDVKSRISPRILPQISPLRKIAKISHVADAPKTSLSQKIVSKSDSSSASKFSTYNVRDRKRKGVLIAEILADSDKMSVKRKTEKSEGIAREFSLTHRVDKCEKDFERMDSVESALRRFDSIGAEFENSGPTSFRASPKISLEKMDMQTKTSVKESIMEESIMCSREVTDDTILRSTLKSPVGDLKVKNIARKSDLKILEKRICPSKKLSKTESSIRNKQRSMQIQSPVCKRQLFGSDSKKQPESIAKMRKKENYSPVNFRCLKDETISKIKSSNKDLNRKIAKKSEELEEMSTISVKPLRSIEDIRKSIDNERNKLITAKESRSVIANRRSASREGVDGRRSISAIDAAGNVLFGGNPMRLTKVKSCVSRITKSPSPDPAARKQHETNMRATRRSAPSSPSKSPDIAPTRPSTELRNQEVKPSRKSVTSKGTDSIRNKAATTGTINTTGDVLQNGSLHESITKKSNAFVIDFDDSSKEDDLVSSKKPPMKKSPSDKQQTASSASGRPTSSISSNSSISPSQGQVFTKGKMSSKKKTSTKPQAKGPFVAKNSGSVTSTNVKLETCSTCGRNFAQDRIDFHQEICAKHGNKKRKKFDAVMFRVKGTELEPFVRRSLAKQKQESNMNQKPDSRQVKSDWRRKHEEFINTIRYAKRQSLGLECNEPPPRLDTSDYIQCPHCGRKFNQAAAERHIPKCEHMLHNKPRVPKFKR